jgi:hypothetical protein
MPTPRPAGPLPRSNPPQPAKSIVPQSSPIPPASKKPLINKLVEDVKQKMAALFPKKPAAGKGGPPQPPKPPRTFTFPKFNAGKIGPIFWTVSSIISFIVNIILIIVVFALVKQVFSVKPLIEDQLIGGLYSNFALMDQARIKAVIPVKDEVPAKFNLPVETNTEVVLSEDTTLSNATVWLSTGAMRIDGAQASIVLPAGTRLPIRLKLDVPVDQKIPVNLKVNVDIPLNQTDLHTPFVGLQKVVEPYYTYLNALPNSWSQALCGSDPSQFCKMVVPDN